jgi:hypothetical protein
MEADGGALFRAERELDPDGTAVLNQHTVRETFTANSQVQAMASRREIGDRGRIADSVAQVECRWRACSGRLRAACSPTRSVGTVLHGAMVWIARRYAIWSRVSFARFDEALSAGLHRRTKREWERLPVALDRATTTILPPFGSSRDSLH